MGLLEHTFTHGGTAWGGPEPAAAGLLTLHEQLADLSCSGRTLTGLLSEMARIARQAVPTAEGASVVAAEPGQRITVGHEGRLSRGAEQHHLEAGYRSWLDADPGPDDLRADGSGSSLGWRLSLDDTTIGALHLYADRSLGFGLADHALGERIAPWIARAVRTATLISRTSQELEHLRTAMATRAVIEQAKGILMERHRFSPSEAFDALVKVSQHTHVKLHTVAETLVRTGELEPPA